MIIHEIKLVQDNIDTVISGRGSGEQGWREKQLGRPVYGESIVGGEGERVCVDGDVHRMGMFHIHCCVCVCVCVGVCVGGGESVTRVNTTFL